MTIEKLRPSFTFTEERLRELQAVVPEAFADGKINWEVLREALGEYLEEETQEHFGLTWSGKREARRLAALPPQGTLVPVPGEGINEKTTRNIFIEGENLEVLKLLQKSYAGRVKMIYIDPPYNTGNDFVYEDDYSESLDEYLRRTDQATEEGRPLTTNVRTGGRYHSRWLSMMYPRLILARQLLTEDGLIFVSIDDHEFHNLRILIAEVFGEENFVGVFVWQSKKGGGSDSSTIVTDHEYIICFSRSMSSDALATVKIEAEPLDKIDDKGAYRRGRELNKWGANSRREDRPTMFFAIPGPKGEDVYPIRNDGAEGCWRWGKKKMFDVVARGDVEFVPRDNGTYIVYEKIRTTAPRSKPYRTWLTGFGTTADGTKAVRDLFNGQKVFDFAKPVDMLKHIVLVGTPDQEGIVLDYFAGSGSTAQAVMELNRADDGYRNFIMVQMPESTPIDSIARKEGLNTISQIGIERIRRHIRSLDNGNQAAISISDEDIGCRILSLQQSHFKQWKTVTSTDPEQLDYLHAEHSSPLRSEWLPTSLTVEILLIEGFPLDSYQTQLELVTANTIWRVHHSDVSHELYICLDETITSATLDMLKMGALVQGDNIFICLDSALSDEAKVVLDDRLRLKVI